MSVTQVGGSQTPQVQQQQPVQTPGTAAGKGATPSDVAGAPTTVIAASSILPSPSLTESELQAALEKLQGKAPDIQKAVSDAAAAFAANSQMTQAFNAGVYTGLLNDVIAAAKSNSGAAFTNLYESVEKSLAAARAAAGGNASLLSVCDTAAKIVDLLQQPGGAVKNADKVAALLKQLDTDCAGLTDKANKGVASAQAELEAAKAAYAADKTDANAAKIKTAEANLAAAEKSAADLRAAAGLAAMLGNVLGLSFEAAKLGDALTQILNRLSHILFQQALPDAAAFSGKVTGAAVFSLLMLLAAQVKEEVMKRVEQADEETRSMEELRDKDKDIKKLLQNKIKDENESKENILTASSALVSVLAQGTDDGWRLLNDILSQRGAGSQSVHPA